MSPSSSCDNTARRVPLGVGRRANPFASDRHAPGAIDWLDGAGSRDVATLDAILDGISRRRADGLAAHGQITGVHGAGKTTLLANLASRARERGWGVAESRAPVVAWPRAVVGEQVIATPRVAFVDSADQMSRARWALTKARARALGVALVVTTHRDLGLSNLAHLTVSVELARRVLEQLAKPAGIALPSDAELEQMLARHNASLRHVIFELYDHFERGWPW